MKRISPEREIMYISNVVEKNIEANKALKDRGLLSQNILSQLRNFVEDVAILINNKENDLDNDTHYDNVSPSINYLKGVSKYKYIVKFHDYLQSTASHYTPNDGDAERLILYYFRYMCMLKETMKKDFNIDVFSNLDDFPIYEDYLLKEHYDSIATKIEEVELKTNKSLVKGRFYVQKVKTIYSNSKIYYEITLTKATNYDNKFERITMYSKLYIPDNYSIKISYIEKDVVLLSNSTKIKIIDNFIISIRPCELINLGKILGLSLKLTDKLNGYINLMKIMTDEEINLLDIVESEEQFNSVIKRIKVGAINDSVCILLNHLRNIIYQNGRGTNILKYLLLNLDNVLIKSQLSHNMNPLLSNLYLLNQSIPFDTMPYAMAMRGYNASWKYLIHSVDMQDREHELLARYVKYNCESNNILYTPIADVEIYGDIQTLVDKYNHILIEAGIDSSGKGKLMIENGNIYINSYEKDSINVIKLLSGYNVENDAFLQDCLNEGLYTYSDVADLTVDKIDILKKMLRNQKVAIIHGPAGTGKTKMLEVISHIFKDFKKIYLANTNTAVNNLERRISSIDYINSTFKTVHSFKNENNRYDILFVDECSTISNKDMYSILSHQEYKLIILSGDIYQIEAIKYGNWFTLAYNYFKNDFVYELIKNNRTTDSNLLDLWAYVRDNDEQAISKINSCEYSSNIDETIFEKTYDDEIVLCLNYDGLYGINNINKILQEKNPGKAFNIGVDTYKINDPIIFNDCPRFHPLLTNNTKGYIREIYIDQDNELNWFTIEVEGFVTDLFENMQGLEILKYSDGGNTTFVRFFVRFFKDTNDDEDDYEHIVPFNLGYAVSIHKAQGLEYKSVKIIITSSIDDNITKNIFYTAITRAKEKLKIYWSSESQIKIFDNFKKRINSRDVSILKRKINI